MVDLSKQFNAHLTQLIEQQELSGASWTVALSGGLDSVVLLHLLHAYQQQVSDIQLKAHHVNHGLSDNALAWSEFCQQLCTALNIPFISSRVHLQKSSRTSLEALARDKRYLAFKEQMAEGEVLATAHHQDDQLETLLLALKRGSGPTGLQGIQGCQGFAKGQLLRPLLTFSREQLLTYARLHQLSWIEDESNLDEQFDRNFIRQQITPLLKKRWPTIAQSFVRSATLCQEQQQLVSEMASDDLALCSETRLGQTVLIIDPLKAFSQARRNNLLRYWLKQSGQNYPSQKQLQLLWQEVALAELDKQPKLQLAEASIQRYRNALYIVADKPLNLPEQVVTWTGQDTLWLVEGQLAVDFSSLDKQLASEHNIYCCFRAQLDPQLSCLPVTRNKSRSIKKLLHEYGVPPWLRDQVVFVICDGQLWQAINLWRCELANLPEQPLTASFH